MVRVMARPKAKLQVVSPCDHALLLSALRLCSGGYGYVRCDRALLLSAFRSNVSCTISLTRTATLALTLTVSTDGAGMLYATRKHSEGAGGAGGA